MAISDTWDETAKRTSTGKPIEALICPVSPSAGYPHDFLPWWGYTSLFNLVDWPSTILPVKDVKVNSKDDAKDPSYQAKDNPFDGLYHEMCKWDGFRCTCMNANGWINQMTPSCGRISPSHCRL